MKILHVMPARFPIQLYGGAERAAYNLAKGLAELGHENFFLCLEGSEIPFAKVLPWNFERPWQEGVPDGIDIVQVYNSPAQEPDFPYLVCIQGNGKAGEQFLKNTVFLSENHARRHHWTEYVYNGIDPAEYPLAKRKNERHLVFLAKASWVVKNLYGAMDLAAHSGCVLDVCGGEAHFWQRWTRPHVNFHGMVGGAEKLRLIQESEALLFPVLWNEPFGVAVIEALACGVPVFASNRGSMPEIIDSSCGAVCRNREEFLVAISRRKEWSPAACRARVENYFTHRHQAEKYLHYYQKILSTGRLREGHAFCDDAFLAEKIYLIPHLRASLRTNYKYLRQKEKLLSIRRERQARSNPA
jgi:glycosyltransferase involved in cell wall biosynthesis